MYIPGYGDVNTMRELRELKVRTDSIEQAMQYKDKYLDNVKSVLQGNISVKLDTTTLTIPQTENIEE
jgi:hypothetical protein